MTLLFPNNDWFKNLEPLFKDPKTKELFEKVDQLYQQNHVLPEENAVFKALQLTSFKDTKVVILGQDPYPNPANAMGLSFSVKPGTKVPVSLQNIYKERYTDLGIQPSQSGDLTNWAKQGVLLLNATLTVNAGDSNSHSKIGWLEFTKGIIEALNTKKEPIVFILWGAFAKSYKPLIGSQHFILESSHPSGFSCHRGFFGSKPFSKTNKLLENSGQKPIDWNN